MYLDTLLKKIVILNRPFNSKQNKIVVLGSAVCDVLHVHQNQVLRLKESVVVRRWMDLEGETKKNTGWLFQNLLSFFLSFLVNFLETTCKKWQIIVKSPLEWFIESHYTEIYNMFLKNTILPFMSILSPHKVFF